MEMYVPTIVPIVDNDQYIKTEDDEHYVNATAIPVRTTRTVFELHNMQYITVHTYVSKCIVNIRQHTKYIQCT